MKVLVINTVSTKRNGITGVIFNLHRAMDHADICMDLLAINEPEANYVQQIEAGGGKVLVLKRSSAHPISYIRRLAKLIRQNGYDAIHAHGNSGTLALEMIAAWLGGCKVRIAHSHSTFTKHKIANSLLKPLLRKLCTHRLACGADAGRWMYGKLPYTVVNNGVDTGRFAFNPNMRKQLRQENGIPAGRTVIGHVGIFDANKNQRFLVEMLKHLTYMGMDCGLLLMGDGKLREQVAEYAQAEGLAERVIFTGATDKVSQYLCACDLFALPSLYEGLPLVLVEAQANGLPCVVSDAVTKEADMTGNVTFLPLADSWAQVVCKMQMPGERSEASKQAVRSLVAENFDVYAEAAKLKEYYIQALEG